MTIGIDNCSLEFNRRASQYFSTSDRRCLQSTKSKYKKNKKKKCKYPEYFWNIIYILNPPFLVIMK